MRTQNIAILSTVVNFELYNRTSKRFPKGIQKYVIDGRNGMHGIDSLLYMVRKLKDKNIEWLVMADEDVVFINPELIYRCIEKMDSEKYSVCGIRDGGVIPHRTFNPYLINTFFSIINFKEILSIWDEKEVLKNRFFIENEFDDDLNSLSGVYDSKSYFEPYYCFYLWLRRKGKKFLFLEATVPFAKDQITNLIKDDAGDHLLFHTWYARMYGVNETHTKRIDEILKKVTIETESGPQPIVYKDKMYGIKRRVKKQSEKVWNKVRSFLK